MTALLALAALAQSGPRFEYASPLPGLPPILIDSRLDGIGIAQQTARAQNLQARILWVDGTANLERVSSAEKVHSLVAKIKATGFNTIVFDVKPIVGYPLYPSKLASKLQAWKTQSLPIDFDPLDAMSREAKAQGIPLYVSLNAFSEGHALFKQGPGYEHPEWQTILYEPKPYLRLGSGRYALNPKANSQPAVDDLVSVTDPAKIVAKDGAFAVTVDRFGRVVDGFEAPGKFDKTPTVPRGGVAVVGYGSGADFLRKNAEPGAMAVWDSEPEFVRISERPEQQYPLMTNPHRADVRARGLAYIEEITKKYPVSGIVYDDRLRFGGLNADFSPEARAGFEAFIGSPVLRWPQDVFEWSINPDMTKGVRPGPRWDDWLAFRAHTMRNWLGEVRKALPPGMQLGVYAGSWYGDYSTYGQNYGSPELETGFWFLTRSYRQASIAPKIDFLMTGCYYGIPTLYEAMGKAKPLGQTIEAAGYLTNRVVRDTTWAYAGIALDGFKGDPDGLARALQAACSTTQGVMVFDLSHDIEPMWPVFAKAFSIPKIAPNQTSVLEEVRRKRARLDQMGVKDPPVVILGGASGIGF